MQNVIKSHNGKRILTTFNDACHKILIFPPGELRAGSDTSKGSCRSWKKIVKSLDDGKVQILSLFLFCFVETSKRDPKPQNAIQNVKGRSKMSKLS